MINILNTILYIILQISVDGFDKAAQENVLFGVLVSIILVLFGVVVFLYKKNDEYIKICDKIRVEMIEREIEINKIIRESEKETLNVLNGVNNVLSINEKSKENDYNNIIHKLDAIEKSIDNL